MRKLEPLVVLCLSVSLFAAPGSSCGQTVAGTSGIFVLAPGDQPLLPEVYARPFVAGGAVRASWGLLEPAEGVFDWSFIDGEAATAASMGKKISIYVLAGSKGTPAWVKDSLPIAAFRYIDPNPYHPTYLDTLSLPIPWDTLYLAKLTAFLQAFGAHCASDTNIAYVRGAACMVTEGWGLVNTDAYGQTWGAYGYTPDTLLYAYRRTLDTYMTAFPATPEWVEVGDIDFEPYISGHGKTYVGERMADYGFQHYPDRFNVWTEDFSDCFPLDPAGNSYWHILHDHPCHNGAQAVWNVQDGAACHYRMLGCDTSGTVCDKDTVLWRAVERCLDYGMTYLEIYRADVLDSSLSGTLQQTADGLLAARSSCLLSDAIAPQDPGAVPLLVYPDPMDEKATVRCAGCAGGAVDYVFNVWGQQIGRPIPFTGDRFTMDRSGAPPGSYVLRITGSDGRSYSTRFAIMALP